MLLVDDRGTGTSGLIDCRRLQAFTGRTSGWAFARRVRQCADTIKGRDFYATSYSAVDWPTPRTRPPAIPDRLLPASVPVLIVGGDLDDLERVRFTADTQASGTRTYDMATGAVEGTVSVAGARVRAAWSPGDDVVKAKLRGAVLAVPSPL